MKTSALVAIIIAAVVVVGGACIGISMSGVFNDTPGTPGNDPVQPTETPVEPTPTETPTPTPTDTPLAYFSGGGYKSDSGSSSSDSETPKPSTKPVEGDEPVTIPDSVITGSIVYDMVMTFPSDYDGSVTFTPISTAPEGKTAYLTVDIKISDKLKTGQTVKISFDVPCAELAAENINEADVCLYHFNGNTWEKIETTYSIGVELVTYTADVANFSPFAVVFEKDGATAEPTTPIDPPTEETPCSHDGEWTISESTTEGKHIETCSLCDEEREVDCEYGTAYEPLAGDFHKQTCLKCEKDSVSQACEAADSYSNDADNEKHWKACTVCGDPVGAVAACTFSETAYSQKDETDSTVSEHYKTCDVCGEKYTESCQYTSDIVSNPDILTHGGQCGLCGKVSSDADCVVKCVSNENGTHTTKCETCGRDKDLDGTAYPTDVTCSDLSYTWDKDTNQHTATCSDCGYEFVAACSYVTADDSFAVGESNKDGTHNSAVCITCGNAKKDITCEYGDFVASEENMHTRSCACGYSETNTCEPVYVQHDGETKTHTLKCNICPRVIQDQMTCFTKYEDIPESAPTTRHCECGREIPLAASLEKSGKLTYYTSVSDAITVAETGNTITLMADMAKPAAEIPDGKKITFVPNNKIAFLNYTSIADVAIDSFAELSDGSAIFVGEEKIGIITTAAELRTVLTQFGLAGAGDGTVYLTQNVDLKGDAWTPITVDGYHGAGVVTIKGNGYTISGLTAPLFSGGFAGKSGIEINDLTIAGSTMTSTNAVGSGAFVEYADSMPVVTLKNCHLIDSSITSTHSDSRIGGLVGYATGYAEENNGPVFMTITIEDCSVERSTITGHSSAAGIIGHAGANKNTETTIKNCAIKGCTITSDKASDYRVGVVVGTANGGNVVISGITSENNTVSQTGATTEKTNDLVGRFALNGTGTVTIDGTVVG